MAAKRHPIVVLVLSSGEPIGTIETSDFRSYADKAGAPAAAFLPGLIEQFNAYKEAIGEPERAVLVLRRKVKSVSLLSCTN